ncbi:hypothetical protein [Streptomyces virginiae]
MACSSGRRDPVPAAWRRLVQNCVYALWPLTAVTLAVIVVRRRDV